MSIYWKNLKSTAENVNKTVDGTKSMTNNKTMKHLDLGKTNNGFKSDKLTNKKYTK